MTDAIGLAPSTPPTLSGLAKIWGIYFRPKEVFASLKLKSVWLLPFITICVVAMIFSYVTYDQRITDAKAKVLSNPNLTEEQRVMIEERIDQQAQKKWTLALAPIFVFIIFAIFSLVLFFVCNVILGGQGKFVTMLSIFIYSSLVGIPEMIIKTPLVMAKNSVEQVHTDLALFLPADLSDKFYYQFLAGFNFFTFWQVLLIATGISILYQFTFKKSFSTVMILWILLIFITTALRTLTGGMLGI